MQYRERNVRHSLLEVSECGPREAPCDNINHTDMLRVCQGYLESFDSRGQWHKKIEAKKMLRDLHKKHSHQFLNKRCLQYGLQRQWTAAIYESAR